MRKISIQLAVFFVCILLSTNFCKGEVEAYKASEINIQYVAFISTAIEFFDIDGLQNTEGFREANFKNEDEGFFIVVKVCDNQGKDFAEDSFLVFDSEEGKT